MMLANSLSAALLLGLFCLCHGQRVTIKPNVEDIQLEISQVNKVFTCNVSGYHSDRFTSLQWSGPNNRSNWEELKKRHRVRSTSRGLELEFRRASHDDSGMYYCIGLHNGYQEYRDEIKITIYNPIKVENCTESQYVVQGSTSQLITCRITGDSLSLAVYKDDVALASNRYKYSKSNISTLDAIEILAPADKQDAGVYRIEVTSEITDTRVNKEISVKVNSKPNFSTTTNFVNVTGEFEVFEGQPAELKCNVTGDPQPLVYWLDPKLRNSSSLSGYQVNPEKGTLLISKTNTTDDNGEFACIARNSVGEASKKVHLTVMQRPTIVSFENKTVLEGNETYLECRATGVPKPTISIQRQGFNRPAYTVGDGYVMAIREVSEASEYIYGVHMKADRSQFGLHYCSATNKVGKAEQVGMLSVQYPPDLSLTPTVHDTYEDKHIALMCHVKAYPAPTVSWLDEVGTELNQSVSIWSLPDEQTHVATMRLPYYKSINRQLECRAENAVGTRTFAVWAKDAWGDGPSIAPELGYPDFDDDEKE